MKKTFIYPKQFSIIPLVRRLFCSISMRNMYIVCTCTMYVTYCGLEQQKNEKKKKS